MSLHLTVRVEKRVFQPGELFVAICRVREAGGDLPRSAGVGGGIRVPAARSPGALRQAFSPQYDHELPLSGNRQVFVRLMAAPKTLSSHPAERIEAGKDYRCSVGLWPKTPGASGTKVLAEQTVTVQFGSVAAGTARPEVTWLASAEQSRLLAIRLDAGGLWTQSALAGLQGLERAMKVWAQVKNPAVFGGQTDARKKGHDIDQLRHYVPVELRERIERIAPINNAIIGWQVRGRGDGSGNWSRLRGALQYPADIQARLGQQLDLNERIEWFDEVNSISSEFIRQTAEVFRGEKSAAWQSVGD